MSDGGFNNPVVGGGGSLVRQQIKSPNYEPATTGWQLSKDGDADLNNTFVRGELDVNGNDSSYIKILTETVSPGREAALIEMSPGTYNDGFTPLPSPAQIIATSEGSGTFVHYGQIQIRSPEYFSLGSAFTLAGAVQEGGVSNTTVAELNTDTFLIASPMGLPMSMQVNGSVTINTGYLSVDKIDEPYGIFVFNAGSVPNAVGNPSAFPLNVGSATRNNGSMWSSGSNVVIPKTGVYEIGFLLNYASNTTGFRQARINVNGTSFKTWNVNANNGTFNTDVGGSIKDVFNAGDVITFSPYQNSGGALNITAYNKAWVKYDMMT